MIGRTNVGGGTGKAFAVIGVTYPEGSTCTCTYGPKTLRLKDTSGQGFFMIPYAATWIVTATDGTDTATQSVEITAEGQSVSVELSYTVNLLKTPGFELVTNLAGYTCHLPSETEDWLEMTATYQNTTNQGQCIVRTKELIDLSDVATIDFGIESATILNSNYSTRFGISASPQNGSLWPTLDAVHEIKQSTGETVASLDVSAVSGEYYVFVQVQGSYNPTGTNKIKINDILTRRA